MIEISLFSAELLLTLIWLICRLFAWRKVGQIHWQREALLVLMYINLAVIIRFVFFPFFRVNGHVAPLAIDPQRILPFRLNFIPFVLITDYDRKREAVINIIGNIALFIPTGILLPILYKKLDRFGRAVLTGVGISLCIELIQLMFPNSVTDIDDLILNALGVAIGYGFYRAARRISHEL